MARDLTRVAVGVGIAFTNVHLAIVEPELNQTAIKRAEAAILGEPLSVFDVAEAVLEARG